MELHDHIGQIMTSLKINLEILNDELKTANPGLVSKTKTIEQRVVETLKEIKNISHGLRPSILDALGLVASLRELFNDIQKGTDIEIKFFNKAIPKRLNPEKALTIYRIVQEGLTNIIKHAQAKEVFVNLTKKDKKLLLSVEDDGVGFDVDKAMKVTKRRGPLGLLIMRERAEQPDGEFTIESKIGKGTHLLVEIPL
jgi:signal transduction histidine kinase